MISGLTLYFVVLAADVILNVAVAAYVFPLSRRYRFLLAFAFSSLVNIFIAVSVRSIACRDLRVGICLADERFIRPSPREHRSVRIGIRAVDSAFSLSRSSISVLEVYRR